MVPPECGRRIGLPEIAHSNVWVRKMPATSDRLPFQNNPQVFVPGQRDSLCEVSEGVRAWEGHPALCGRFGFLSQEGPLSWYVPKIPRGQVSDSGPATAASCQTGLGGPNCHFAAIRERERLPSIPPLPFAS